MVGVFNDTRVTRPRSVGPAIVVLMAVIATSCRARVTDISPYEPAIYAAAIDSVFAFSRGRPDRGISLSRKTSAMRIDRFSERQLKPFRDALGSDSALVNEFAVTARSTKPLPYDIAMISRISRVSVSEVSEDTLRVLARVAKRAVKRDSLGITDETFWSWRVIYDGLPNIFAFATVTSIVYTRDGRHALLHLSYYCGGTCGSGHVISLDRRADGWHVVKLVMTWVS